MNPTGDPDILLKAEELLVRRGGVTVLDIPALDVFSGQVLALIGPNGAGKSTLLLTLAGLLKPVRGSLLFRGERIGNGGFDYRRHIAMVFQEPLLFDATVFDNVAAGLKLTGMKKGKNLDEVVKNSLLQASLWDEVKDDLHKPGTSISGGQQQRLCIARAIAMQPEVILMDEPCSALDPIATSKVEELMVQLKGTYTVVVVTHNMQQAARVADNTAFFYLGKLIESGPTTSLFENPKEDLTERYLTGRFG